MYSVDEINQDFIQIEYWDYQVEFRINNQSRCFNINTMDQVFMGEQISIKTAIAQKKTLNCFIDIGEETGEDFLMIGSVSITWNPKTNECYIGTIWVEPEFRGNGFSTHIFNEITNFADELGIILTLHAFPFINLDHKPTDEEISKLKDYYRRFGFKENPKTKGIGFDCSMERIPRDYPYQNN